MAKKTLEELMADKAEELHNSNMENLASLVRQHEDGIAASQHAIAWHEEQIAKVKALGASDDLQITDAVKELHNARMPEFKGRRW